MELTDFLHAGTNLYKLKGDWEFLGRAGDGILKLTGRTDFLHVNTNSQKLKADQKFLGWARSKVGVARLIMELYN